MLSAQRRQANGFWADDKRTIFRIIGDYENDPLVMIL